MFWLGGGRGVLNLDMMGLNTLLSALTNRGPSVVEIPLNISQAGLDQDRVVRVEPKPYVYPIMDRMLEVMEQANSGASPLTGLQLAEIAAGDIMIDAFHKRINERDDFTDYHNIAEFGTKFRVLKDSLIRDGKIQADTKLPVLELAKTSPDNFLALFTLCNLGGSKDNSMVSKEQAENFLKEVSDRKPEIINSLGFVSALPLIELIGVERSCSKSNGSRLQTDGMRTLGFVREFIDAHTVHSSALSYDLSRSEAWRFIEREFCREDARSNQI